MPETHVCAGHACTGPLHHLHRHTLAQASWARRSQRRWPLSCSLKDEWWVSGDGGSVWEENGWGRAGRNRGSRASSLSATGGLRKQQRGKEGGRD